MRTRLEQGAALPTVAMMLVVLLGMAAFAVDLGWLYLNANRVQKTADAAALAGVVNLPSNVSQARSDAAAAVSANGLVDTSMTATPLSDNRLRVDLSMPTETFFMGVFGISSVNVSRTATAQYILPVPLGSPDNCMGRDPTGLYCSGDPGFWVAISGSETAKIHGDAFTARCLGNEGNGPAWTCEGGNAEQRAGGYTYGVEVEPGTTSLTVRLYDAGFYDRFADGIGFDPNIPYEVVVSAGGGVDTVFRLLAPDNTPYDASDNPAITGCSRSIPSGAQPGTYRDRWAELCTISNGGSEIPPGIYVLEVTVAGSTGGSNAFSIAATAVGPAARVYGLNDMGLYNNNNGSTATINLAEIEEVHAGKTMLVHLFDPGDAQAEARIDILQPNGSVATCSWSARADTGTPGPAGSGQCSILTTAAEGASDWNRRYNGQWLDIRIEIPDPGDYDCSTDCFWQVRYQFSGGTRATDRTTWAVAVIGNPVRLVPNTP